MHRTEFFPVRSKSLHAASSVIVFLLSVVTALGPTTAPLLHIDDVVALEKETPCPGVHGTSCPHENEHPHHDGPACLLCSTLQSGKSPAMNGPRHHHPLRRGEAIRTVAEDGTHKNHSLTASVPRAPPTLS
jgi:hypothetical protein